MTKTECRPGWTMDQALAQVLELGGVLKPLGIEIGMCGSVLKKGASEKDLDLLLFPTTTVRAIDYPDKFSFEAIMPALTTALADLGISRLYDRRFVQEQWRFMGSFDTKWVEVWRNANGQRIDFFFLT